MTGEHRANPVAEVVLLALTTAGLGALAVYYLPYKFLIDFAWGLPIILLVRRFGWQTGVMSMVLSFLVTWLLTVPLSPALLLTGLLFVELGPLALAYGLIFKNEYSPGRVLLIGTAVSVVSTIILMLILVKVDPGSIIPDKAVILRQAEVATALYTKMGLMTADDAKNLIPASYDLARIFIPCFYVGSAVIRAFITYILAAGILRRLSYKADRLPRFSQWRLPWYSIWLMIAGLGMALTGDQFNLAPVALTGKVMAISSLPLFFLMGLAVITHFFKAWRIPGWVKALMVIFGIYNLLASLVMFTLIGMFDPLVSFRKWSRPKEQ